jgi:hypothetical protein
MALFEAFRNCTEKLIRTMSNISAFSKRHWTMLSHSADSTTSRPSTLSNRNGIFGDLPTFETMKLIFVGICRLFPKDEFHPFEVAQLANLCCETAEEAKILIPR